MPALVVAVAVLGTWYVMRKWQASKGPDAVRKAGEGLRWVRKGIVAVVAVAMLAAMAQGCDGDGPSSGRTDGPDGEPCTAFHEEDCPPGGVAPPTPVDGGGDGNDVDEPRRLPCPAYRAEDCPLAPVAGTAPPSARGDDGIPRQVCPAYRVEDCPPV